MTPIEQFLRKSVKVNLQHRLLLGMTQSKMAHAFCWFSQFQCFKESINMQNNDYKAYNV
jgi:hypothetical protein